MEKDHIVWSNGRVQIKKKYVDVDPNFWRNGRAQNK